MQNTSFVISTERGRLRKENLEAQLTQVEKDIEKMVRTRRLSTCDFVLIDL